VEDLAQSIQDTQARIEMLTTYRKQLLELRAKATTNIEAAIKIASELSTVQSDLERATGEAAFQTKRVTTDVVTLRFDVTEQREFWRPVREACRDFLGHLRKACLRRLRRWRISCRGSLSSYLGGTCCDSCGGGGGGNAVRILIAHRAAIRFRSRRLFTRFLHHAPT